MTLEEQIIAAIKEGFEQVAKENGAKPEDAIKNNKEKDDDVDSLFGSSSKGSNDSGNNFINNFTNFNVASLFGQTIILEDSLINLLFA